MSQIQTIKKKLQALLPKLSSVIDEPRNSDGPWMLDVALGNRAVNIEWRPHRGFGISSHDPHRKSYYGEGPDEILSSVDETVERVFELIKSGENTATPSELTLAELRERLRFSQAQLARRLRVSQAAVSDLEKNVAKSQLLTLRKAIKALGAELEIRAVLPNAQGFTLKLPETGTPRLRRNNQPRKHQRMEVMQEPESDLTTPYFCDETLDDVMRSVIREIQAHGSLIHPTKGPAKELTGVLLEITNPRSRLSRSETRGKPFSCLGELCWYLAKTNQLDFISYYISAYKKLAEGNVIFGGYGPRLFTWRGVDQVGNVANLLARKRDSRQAVIQLFDAQDIVEEHKDIPCTCTLQFLIRNDTLHMFTSMRSNDVFRGLPHDVFCFTMLQEIMARKLSVEIGPYKHAVGSLHLYEKNNRAAQQFLDEGWQSTTPMPPMPIGDPWPAIALLLEAEAAIRTGNKLDASKLKNIDPYWADLIRLLQIHRCRKDKNADKIKELRTKMSSGTYAIFIDKVLSVLSQLQ